MKRALILFLAAAGVASAQTYDTVVKLIGDIPIGSWSIPSNFNNSDNKIECLGTGGSGTSRGSNSYAGVGGGGGAYAVKTNVTLGTPGTGLVDYRVTIGATTYIKNSAGSIQVQADYGRNGVAGTPGTPGARGQAILCTPTTGAFNGGTGAGNGVSSVGGGGGGAGGPSGTGGDATGGGSVTSGSGNNGTEAAQTTAGAQGNYGSEWGIIGGVPIGCGSGGAGGSGSGSRNGGAGGGLTNGGAGGGGSNTGSAGVGGQGSYGQIIISYNATAGVSPTPTATATATATPTATPTASPTITPVTTYDTVVTLTSSDTSPWSIPVGFNNSGNKIECVGRGGKGSSRVSTNVGGNGGGGGAYCFAFNVNLGTPGSQTAAFQVGSNSSAVVSFIKNAAGTIQVQSDYGRDAITTAYGDGGSVANNVPANTGYSGGPGGENITGDPGAGGGGAAGPNGEGTSGTDNIIGGDADNSTLDGAYRVGDPGLNGSEWGASAGCGSGGAAGYISPINGGRGGAYGGGGGGSDSGASALGGAGSDGLIIISYASTNATPSPTPTASPTATATAGPAHKSKMFLAPRP